MERTFNEHTPTQNKSQVRVWIYKLLIALEESEDVEGHKSETGSNKVTIELQFKS
jgi:hypothetical protein